MEVNQGHAAGPPPPEPNLSNENDALVRSRQIEAIAYQALINEGGRPSHPLRLLEDIVAGPGQYRDILAFWQDRSDEWQVFSKQLSRWQTFRAHQRTSREADRFPSYVEDLTARLQRHGFDLPASFDKPPSGFSRHLDRQNKLATWVEYLNYEFTRRDEYDKWLETCRPGYNEALTQLVEAQVLRPFESVRTPARDICRPSSIEITRRKFERRNAEDAYQAAKHLAQRKGIHELQCQQQINHDSRLTETRKHLEAVNKRAFCIADFTRKTHAYRFALDRSERHELLLQWALDQVPLIEREVEEAMAAAARADQSCEGDAQEEIRTFPRFQQLPPEIRLKIWTECLPRQPSVHFFEVLNQQRKRHLASSWSSKEFRVRATTSRDSGYLIVYTLLGVSRESRFAVETYYSRSNGDSKPWPHKSGGTSTSRQLDFRSFDWIPVNDLIILCFPPVQVPKLPLGNAFTLGHGPNQTPRRIGALIPEEILIMSQTFSLSDDAESENDAAQVSLIPSFIDGLHGPVHRKAHEGSERRRGIKKLYLIVEGWTINHEILQGTFGVDSTKDITAWSESRSFWHFDSTMQYESPPAGKYFSASSWPDEDEVPLPKKGPWRQLWWLGSGKKALASYELEDFLEKAPVRRISEFLRTLETECDQQRWHKGFEGVESLGWMEPAKERLLDRRPLDLAQVLQVKLGEHLNGQELDLLSELP